MLNQGTTNFIQLYMHISGHTEVPKDFHLWCAFSLLAAAVGDQVYIEKFKGDQLVPNLMVFLLGPSAGGKGTAVKQAMRLIHGLDAFRTFQGGGSIQGIVKRMARRNDPRIYLVTEELAMDLPEGGGAKAFVKYVTGLYTRQRTAYERETLADGHLELPGVPTLNWLAGSTRQWLVETIDKNAMKSGFGGRMIPVERDYNTEHRVTNPQSPGDYDEVWAFLRDRLEALTFLSGEFRRTNEARQVEEDWYMHRPAPTDELLLPAWKREHDLLLKLAMLLSLADGGPLVITNHHMASAIKFVALGTKSMGDIIRYSEQTLQTIDIDMIRRIIEKHGLIQRTMLMRMVSGRGIDKRRLDDIIGTLEAEGTVLLVAPPPGRGGAYYAWHQWRGLEEHKHNAERFARLEARTGTAVK